MADPFSAAGSVVGVVSLGITVAQGLVNYYGAWKDCGDDVRSTLASLQDLSTTLEILRSQLSQAQRPQNHVLHLEKTIGSCADAIARLDHKLEKIQKHRKLGQFERLRYPFRRGTIGKLQDLIAELRGNLQLLLEVLQVDVASTQTVKLDHVTSTLVGLDQKVDDFQSKEELRQIRLWLNAPDPRVNHAVARQKHEPQTGSWFVDSGHFSSWLTLPNSTYWLHGLRKLLSQNVAWNHAYSCRCSWMWKNNFKVFLWTEKVSLPRPSTNAFYLARPSLSGQNNGLC